MRIQISLHSSDKGVISVRLILLLTLPWFETRALKTRLQRHIVGPSRMSLETSDIESLGP